MDKEEWTIDEGARAMKNYVVYYKHDDRLAKAILANTAEEAKQQAAAEWGITIEEIEIDNG